ncbi:Hypp4250 [Branchiostoma lanceolatum]|uniref:Carbonic anhydrase n=1 Tax=Branchiostoma lanceolatum TaxID=7740 RepID=A0A8K0A9F4_BRALA|nr:Hypp4250 [Branchiostoma lanceolatum]
MKLFLRNLLGKSCSIQNLKQTSQELKPRVVILTCVEAAARRFLSSSLQHDAVVLCSPGNLIPHSKLYGKEVLGSEVASMEWACSQGSLEHVVVCGHSNCQILGALGKWQIQSASNVMSSPFLSWLTQHGNSTLTRFERYEMDRLQPMTFQGISPKELWDAYVDPQCHWTDQDQFSQVNVLQQLQNVSSHGFLKPKLKSGALQLHGMWLDSREQSPYLFSKEQQRFMQITDDNIDSLLKI